MVYSIAVTTTFVIEGGYELIPLSRLGNALAFFIEGYLSVRSFRVFLALISMQAIREAAKKSGRKTGSWVCFRIEEIQERVGLSQREIQKALQCLKASGLVQFESEAIIFADAPLPLAQETIEILAGRRSPHRRIPMPRRVLEYLARCKKPAFLRAIVVILVRGLTLRRGGAINLAGSVKSSWIAQVAGISLRSSKAARQNLISLGLISQDIQSTQTKLNRTGAYFTVNAEWSLPSQEPSAVPQASQTKVAHTTPPAQLTPDHGREESKAVDSIAVSAPQFAPPRTQKCPQFAPPEQDKGTSYEEFKNQKTRARRNRSGVNQPVKIIPQTPHLQPATPTLRNIQLSDLTHLDRLESLYWQSIDKGWLPRHTEANALNFVAAAVRARRVTEEGKKGDPVRVFVSLVKHRRWHFITQNQEDYARAALNRYRGTHPDLFRCPPTSSTEELRASLSNVPRFIRALLCPLSLKT